MNIALDTNAYSDFMRGDGDRVRIVRAARSISMPIIVRGELSGPERHRSGLCIQIPEKKGPLI